MKLNDNNNSKIPYFTKIANCLALIECVGVFWVAHHGRTVRAKGFFFMNIFFCQGCQIVLMFQVSKQSFLGGLCSEQNTFSCATAALCVRSDFYFIS